jgi:hypothetical protein
MQLDPFVHGSGGQRDRATAVGKRVVDEVADRLLDACWIRIQRDVHERRDRNGAPCFGGACRESFGDALEDLGRLLARLGSRSSGR